MDPVSLVLDALAAGAKQNTAVRDLGDVQRADANPAYAKLTRLVRAKFSGSTWAELALAKYATDPETWERPLLKALRDFDASSDTGIIRAAQDLMALLDRTGTSQGRYLVDLRDDAIIQGIQVGKKNKMYNTFYNWGASTQGPCNSRVHRIRRFLVITCAGIVLAGAVGGVLMLATPGKLGASPDPAIHKAQAPTPLWSAPLTGTLVTTLPAGGRSPAVDFAANGTTLAVGGDTGITYLWDTATRELTATLPNPAEGAVEAVAFASRGTTLATSDANGQTYLWDTATGKLTATLTDPRSASAQVVAFGPNGTTLAAGGQAGTTYLWDTATRKLTATLPNPGAQGAVEAVAFAPHGTTLATCTYNINSTPGGSTYLWDTATGKLTATLADPNSQGVISIAFAPGGTTLATSDANGNIYLWDTATGKITATLADPGAHETGQVIAFAPGGTTLAISAWNVNSLSGGGSSYLWDTATGKITAALTDPDTQGVTSIAFAPGGTTLATGDANGNTYLWRITSASA